MRRQNGTCLRQAEILGKGLHGQVYDVPVLVLGLGVLWGVCERGQHKQARHRAAAEFGTSISARPIIITASIHTLALTERCSSRHHSLTHTHLNSLGMREVAGQDKNGSQMGSEASKQASSSSQTPHSPPFSASPHHRHHHTPACLPHPVIHARL